MSKVQIPAEIDTQAFMSSLTSLKISELETFARELNGLIYRKKSQDKSYREKELLRLINSTFLSREKQARYVELSNKIEEETISKAEHRELSELAAEEEDIRNQRAKLLFELAQLRNVPLPQLMERMGLKPPGHVYN